MTPNWYNTAIVLYCTNWYNRAKVDIEGVGIISVRVEHPWGSKVCSICKASDHSDKDCKRGKKISVPTRKASVKNLSEKLASQAENAPLDANQAPVQPQQSGDAQTTNQSEGAAIVNQSDDAQAIATTQSEGAAQQPSAEEKDSQSGVKSAFRLGKENNNSSTLGSKKNPSSGSSNKFCALADLVDEPQKVGDYPLRDRKLIQKAAESKSQCGKKKVLGDLGGTAGFMFQNLIQDHFLEC